MTNISAQKDKIAIVVVGYNRLSGLQRLLNSLLKANYPVDGVPLVISIDASGNQGLYDYVNSFIWPYGQLSINIEKERLGLKRHIFQCASLSKYFKGVIILEDDLFVSPFFYHYCEECLEKYGDNEKVAGISLYSEETNGYVGLPFQPEQSGGDVFAWQTVCSWGELWNERMWNEFTEWLKKWDGDFGPIDMMNRIKGWERAWSKFFYAYLISNDKYFIYPYQSLTTNFNDAGGEHGGGDNGIVQVSLLQGKKNYQFEPFEDLVRYDVYCQNKGIPQWLNVDEDDITVDYYGLKDTYKGHYILSPFQLPYEVVDSYALSMRPWELNIKYDIKGTGVYLYRRENVYSESKHNKETPVYLSEYYLRGFNWRALLRVVNKRLLKLLKSRIG